MLMNGNFLPLDKRIPYVLSVVYGFTCPSILIGGPVSGVIDTDDC